MQYLKINSEKPENEIIGQAVTTLRKGGVIILPTETVYGIAGDLLSQKAVNRIYALKKRNSQNPLPVFLPSIEELNSYVQEISPSTYNVIRKFWPGPLTVILPKREEIQLPFPTHTLGLRIPNHPVPLQLLSQTGPLACSSANISGKSPALTAEDARKYFKDKVDLILDGGPLSDNIPSTVLDLSGEEPKILREGKIKREAIEKLLNCKVKKEEPPRT